MTAIQELFPVLRYSKVEADDTAAYLTQALPKHFDIKQIWLISSDRDWDLMVSPIISRFSYVTRKEITHSNWKDHYDCEPEEYISIKCLNGDSGDNVRGVVGIGPKRAADLVKQYGSALDIVAALPITSKYKFMQELNKSADLIMLNYQLMDLVTFHEEAIGEANIASINATILPYLKDIKKCK
jgi:DNA polymerase-1